MPQPTELFWPNLTMKLMKYWRGWPTNQERIELQNLVIQKLNAEGRLEKKEAKKGSYFDKVWECVKLTFLFCGLIGLFTALLKSMLLLGVFL